MSIHTPLRARLLAACMVLLSIPVPRLAAQAAAKPDEDVVKMEAFKVNTTIGTYHEKSSVTAAKIPIELKDLAATLQIFNSGFMEDKLATTVEDVYSYVTGMTRENTAATGFTLRGFSSNPQNTILNNVLYDGLSGGASRFGSPSTAVVERIEVLKGPSAVLYGAASPGGLINIVTKSPQATRANVLKLTAESFAGHGTGLGEDPGYQASLDSTGSIDKDKRWLYRLIVGYEDLAAWRDFHWTRNLFLLPQLTYRPNENTEVTLKAEQIAQHRFSTAQTELAAPFNLIANVPSDHSLVYQEPDNDEYDRGTTFGLTATHRFQNKWTAKFSSRHVIHIDGRHLFEFRVLNNATPLANSNIAMRYRHQWNRRKYTYVDFNLVGELGPEKFKHTIVAGGGYGYEAEDFSRWIFANAIGPNINVYNPVHGLLTKPVYNPAAGPTQMAVQRYHNYSGYLSDQIKIGSQWRASFGVRYDKYNSVYHDWANLNGRFAVPGTHNNSQTTVPQFGLLYQPRESISLYASYVLGFKPAAAQAVDSYNVGFPPEKSNQLEFGIKADLLDNKASVTVSVYSLERTNVTEPVPGIIDANGFTVYRNLAAGSDGAEVNLNYQPLRHWQMQLGYSYISAQVKVSANPALLGATLAQAPRHQGNFWTRYNVPSGPLVGFGTGLGLLYVGSRHGTATIVPANKMLIPSNFRTDLALYYKLRRSQLALSVSNLFDLKYIASADVNTNVHPGDARKISFTLTHNF